MVWLVCDEGAEEPPCEQGVRLHLELALAVCELCSEGSRRMQMEFLDDAHKTRWPAQFAGKEQEPRLAGKLGSGLAASIPTPTTCQRASNSSDRSDMISLIQVYCNTLLVTV